MKPSLKMLIAVLLALSMTSAAAAQYLYRYGMDNLKAAPTGDPFSAPSAGSVSPESPPSQPPIANDDVFAFVASGTYLDLASNDSDPEGHLNLGSIVVTRAPSVGSVDAILPSGEILYSFPQGAAGGDSFAYVISDDQGVVSNEAMVSISIRSAASAFFNSPDILGNVNLTQAADGIVLFSRPASIRPTQTLMTSGKWYWEAAFLGGNIYYFSGVAPADAADFNNTGTLRGYYTYTDRFAGVTRIGYAFDADTRQLRIVVRTSSGDVERTSCYGCEFTAVPSSAGYLPAASNKDSGSGTTTLQYAIAEPDFQLKASFPWLSEYQPLSNLLP